MTTALLNRLTYHIAALCEPIGPATLTMPLLAWSWWMWGEPELRVLRLLVPPDAIAVDVGGAEGGYAYFLSRYARECHVFEANPESAAVIRRRVPHARVHAMALSSRSGTAELRVPVVNGVPYTGWASIQHGNGFQALPEHEVRSHEVGTATLDSFELRNVGFIKIDVEGHELAVLQGAMATLQRDRPILLVEAADTHRPRALSSLQDLLRPLAYRTWQLRDGRLHPVPEDGVPAEGSAADSSNFFFIPRSRSLAPSLTASTA